MPIKKNLSNKHYLSEFKFDDDSLDIVYIKKLKGKTIIGICDDELFDPQEINLDIFIGVSNIRACNSDNINHTIDYDKVRSSVLEVMANHKFKLLESFAESIADLILNSFGACWVKIDVTKPKKYNDVDYVGIVIERSKNSTKINNNNKNILKVIGAGHVPKS